MTVARSEEVDMIDPGLKPMCDQMHGEMQKRWLVDPLTGGLGNAVFQCQNEICGRVYSDGNGYRDWVQGKGGGKPNPSDPRCKEHLRWMYVREVLPDFRLLYGCPELRCDGTETVQMEDDDSGIWKGKSPLKE
jgi:hypothetical protein